MRADVAAQGVLAVELRPDTTDIPGGRRHLGDVGHPKSAGSACTDNRDGQSDSLDVHIQTLRRDIVRGPGRLAVAPAGRVTFVRYLL